MYGALATYAVVRNAIEEHGAETALQDEAGKPLLAIFWSVEDAKRFEAWALDFGLCPTRKVMTVHLSI